MTNLKHKGGLIMDMDPDGKLVLHPGPDVKMPDETDYIDRLGILTTLADSFEAGSERSDIKVLAGSKDQASVLNPDYVGPIDWDAPLDTELLSSEQLAYNEKPFDQKVEYQVERARRALSQHCELWNKRVRGAIEEVLEGAIVVPGDVKRIKDPKSEAVFLESQLLLKEDE